MKKRLLTFLFILFAAFSLASCGNEEQPKVTISSISVVESTIPTSVLTTEVNDKLDDIQITITKSDASTETINLSTTMIPSADLAKLETAGTHTITIKHQGKTTTFTIVVTEPEVQNEYYTVKVVYPDGTPVTGGVTVQWCNTLGCRDALVNAEGVATLEKEDGEYSVHLLNMPQGYTSNPNCYITTPENKNIEVKLIALSTLTGEGTDSNPFVVSTNAYSVTYTIEENSDLKYFSFTPIDSGEYSIESYVLDTQLVDPYIGFLGDNITNGNHDVTGNTEGVLNFNHKFTAEAGKTYYFAIMLENEIKTNKTFEINITKLN